MITNYQNPIIRGMHPDPSIVRVDDTYYMANSTFEYYPGIAISRSTDLLNWTKLPSVIQLPTQADLRNAKSNEGIFAVCIRYYCKHFYVITTNFSEFKTFIIRGKLAADGKDIEWEDTRITVDIMGIDPDLYFEDRCTYLQFTGYIDDKRTKAIQQVEINLESGDILQGPKVLTLGTGGRDVEGPHIIKKNGWYYLLIAEGGTGMGHMVTMLRSQSLWGPYVEEPEVNPLFTNRDRSEEPLQNIGHSDLFQDTAGNWWLTCLGTRPSSIDFTRITNLGRETLLYPVKWDQEWPVIYNGIPAENIDLTSFPDHAKSLSRKQKMTAFVDTFDETTPHPEWVTLRNHLGTQLTVGNGKMILKGNAQTLSNLGTPAFIGLRQTEHNENFQITLDTEKTKLNNGKIGIVTLINVDHYAALLIEKIKEGYQVIRYQKVADLELTEILGNLKELPTIFNLTSHDATKTFSVENELTGENINFTTSSIHFSNEAIAALNTGDFQGIYALGNSEMVIIRAERRKLMEDQN